jgi:hypothetical protein
METRPRAILKSQGATTRRGRNPMAAQIGALRKG